MMEWTETGTAASALCASRTEPGFTSQGPHSRTPREAVRKRPAAAAPPPRSKRAHVRDADAAVIGAARELDAVPLREAGFCLLADVANSLAPRRNNCRLEHS